MAQPKFRLETLLSIRENLLKEKQAELAKAYEAERIVEEKRRKTLDEMVALSGQARSMMQSGRIDVGFLLGARRHEAFLLAMRKDMDEKLVLIRQEIDLRRQAVIEANKEVKILEKLKEKQRERYRIEQGKSDVKRMDEIAEMRTARLAKSQSDEQVS